MSRARPDFVTNFDSSPPSRSSLRDEEKRDDSNWGSRDNEAAEQYYQRRAHSSSSSTGAATASAKPRVSSSNSTSSRVSSSSSRLAKERPQFITKFESDSSPSFERGRVGGNDIDNISEVSTVGVNESDAYIDSFYTRKKTVGAGAGPSSSSSSRGVFSAGQPSAAMGTSSTLPKDYAALLEGYKVLQYQNALLSKQLQQLHNSVVVRERCETKVALLLADLISSIEEIAGIAKGAGRGFGEKEKEGASAATSQYQQRGPASNSSSSMAVWTTVHRSLQELQSQWKQSLRDGRVAVLNSVQIHPLTSNFVTLKGSNNTRSRPANIRLNQVLGVNSSNISFLSDACGLNGDTDSYLDHDYRSDVGRVGLDIARICTLQNDLVSFANDANDLLQQLPVSGGGSSRAVVERLKQCCEGLLVHLAGFSPVAPLEADPPLTSSASGLDNLINMSEKILQQSPKAGRGIATAWQDAVDRARAEQLAIARILVQARQRLGES